MAIVCPTVLAGEPHEFREQIERVAPFASRIQIDLMDGAFAPTKSVALDSIWWPEGLDVDIHLMYQEPERYLEKLVNLRPNMVIIHAEANVDLVKFATALHENNIKAGLAVLKDTQVKEVQHFLPNFDHLLIFSGDLGRFGGQVDMSLLEKVSEAKKIVPNIEVGWDGGINETNALDLSNGGVEVLNVGGYIQRASQPDKAYVTISSLIS
ncbi:hypothetical protein KC968_00980 [Candidatus Saccharibacteria bacterium]|nr:hypothetical protein [Candidatus Saccharibacteria bacterium]